MCSIVSRRIVCCVNFPPRGRGSSGKVSIIDVKVHGGEGVHRNEAFYDWKQLPPAAPAEVKVFACVPVGACLS